MDNQELFSLVKIFHGNIDYLVQNSSQEEKQANIR